MLLSNTASDELLGYEFSAALFSGAATNYDIYRDVDGTDWLGVLSNASVGTNSEEYEELLNHYGLSG
jgi:hypothetical protein